MADAGKPDPTGEAEDPEKDEGTELEGGEQGGTDPSKSGKPEGKPKSGGQEKTFTQAEVDAMIKKRVAKLEPKASKWDEHQAEQQTAEEKAAAVKAEQDQKTAERIASADARLILAEIKLQIAAQGVDPEFQDLVEAAVAQADTVSVDDGGEVIGVEEAVKRLLAEKPKLKAAAGGKPTGKSGGEFHGTDGKTGAQKLADVEAQRDQAAAKGDRPVTRNAVLEGIRLKLAGRK